VCPGQLARISTNHTGPEVNDHISLQWPSYEQPQGSNLRLQRKQTSLSQALTTGLPSRWFFKNFPFTGKWFEETKQAMKWPGNQIEKDPPLCLAMDSN